MVISLADIVRLVNRFPHLAGKAVFASSADLLIPHLHGFPTGGAVDNTVEQVVEGAGIAFHNRRPATVSYTPLAVYKRQGLKNGDSLIEKCHKL